MGYRRRRFLKGLLIYVLILALLGAAALGVLYLYLDAYEASRPSSALRGYLTGAERGTLGYGWGRCLAEMDRSFQPEEELRAWVGEKLASAEVRELRSDDTDLKRFALLDSDGTCFEELTLRRGDKDRWGFTPWTVSDETCSIEAYKHSFSLRVPADYTVILGGRTLDAGETGRTGLNYELLTPFVNHVSKLPTLVEYRVGPFLGEQTVQVLDASGEEVSVEDLNEYRFLSGSCTRKEEERLHAFVIDYLNVYLPYAGDLNRFGIMYWDQLYGMIVHNGELQERLVQAREGFGFGNTYSVEILSDEVRLYAKLSENTYVVDLSYRIETVGLHGPVQEDNQVRLLIVEEDGQLYVQSMYSYSD